MLAIINKGCLPMQRKLVITHYIPPEFRKNIPESFETIMPLEKGAFTRAELLEKLADADALLIIRGRCGADIIDSAPKLKVIGTSSVGYDHIDCDYAYGKGIAVLNTPNAVTETTAELTIALMMAIMRRIPQFDRYSRTELRTMVREYGSPCTRLFGKTLGIIGFGRIGEAVARRAVGLGMSVIYNNSSGIRENSVGAEYASLEELLKKSDVVSLHMPLTSATRRMICESELGLMKPTSYLINMARGPVICESDLIYALKHGKIAGAALDVYEAEPDISPELAELDNVILSPHVGTFDDETRAEMAYEVIRGIVEFLSGGTPKNRVV